MKDLKILVAAIIVVVFAACSSVRTYSDFDKNADFSSYKTFNFWKKGVELLKLSDLDKRRLVQNVEKELLAKGLKVSDEPDLLVNLIATGDKKIDVDSFGPYYWGWWGHYPHTTVRQYTEGKLYIELVDRKAKQLIWQGKGVSEFYEGVKDRDAKVAEVVNKILEKYPPEL